MQLTTLLALACAAAVSARSVPLRRTSVNLFQNGEDAIALNQQFALLTADFPCQPGQVACVQNQLATCGTNGTFALTPCSASQVCAAVPKTDAPGVDIACTTAADRDAQIASATAASSAASTPATGTSSSSAAASASATATQAAANATASGAGPAGNATDPQSSLTLLPSVIATGFENDGQDQAEAGQVPSLTSSNNFINFCATVPQLPLTNGQQVKTGSCNPAPMGVVAASTNMPSAKFVFPTHAATLRANATFTVQLAVAHLATGHFTNADTSYYSAPQQVDAAGDVVGHTHIVIEQLQALNQTAPTDPGQFAFFKGLNDVAQNGILTANVTGGLGPGAYRIASINSAANHQPVLVAIAQRGALDDMVYFTVA